MLKKILLVSKKILLAIFVLYSFNVLSSGVNLNVPVNAITVSMVGIFGIPAIISLVIIKIIIF